MSSRVGDVGDDDPSSSAVVARARVLRETLRRRDDDYEVDRPGARASLDAIVADPAWLAEYEELKRLERALAGEPGEGRCARYVPRKRRFCAAKARDGGTMCSRHRAFEEGDADETLCRDEEQRLGASCSCFACTKDGVVKGSRLGMKISKIPSTQY